MMRSLLLAVQFLTRLPIRVGAPTSKQIAVSYCFYPVVGALIGLAAVVMRHVFELVFPNAFSVALTLAFLVWITSGLHEDGLSDVADGMGAGWTREQRLAIMKDSHIGAYGTLAIVFAVLIKYAALTGMERTQVDQALVTAHVLGRWAFLPLGFFNRPARDGLGSEFTKGMTPGAMLSATLVVMAALIVFLGAGALQYFALAAAAVAAASVYFRRKIGGVTGDCFGATFQIVEIGTYALFLA